MRSEIHSEEMEEKKLPDFVDYDAYDAEVFKCAQTKPRPQTLTPGYNPYTRNRGIEHGRIEKFLKNEKLIQFGDGVHDSSSTSLHRTISTVSLSSLHPLISNILGLIFFTSTL